MLKHYWVREAPDEALFASLSFLIEHFFFVHAKATLAYSRNE